ncbi:MAG TPA: AI-2E family transporter [Nitrolancea sp.]|nr:AI-2E family transporter [Nitrolancea sp.]
MQERTGSAAQRKTAEPAASAKERAAAQWRRLGDAILTVTPSGVARTIFAAIAIVVPIWLAWASWPAIVPFIVGGAIAYAVLPLVNTLDRFMPRLAAALLATGSVILIVIAIPVLILRVLTLEVYNTYRSLPTADEVHHFIDNLDQSLNSWPVPIQIFVRTRAQDTILSMRAGIIDYVSNADNLAVHVILGAFNTIGIFLGLLVLPVWILLALRDQRAAHAAVDNRLPGWLKGDFWAVARILDRTIGAYIRGLSVIALATGVGTFIGLYALKTADVEGIRYPLAFSVLAAVLELIPTIGPILSTLLAFVISLRASPSTALAVAGTFVVVHLLVRKFVGERVERRVIDLHPAILIIGVVALSQFGLGWALFAAPLIAIARDLFRYTYGRLSDPPHPAGLLPGESPPVTTATELQAPVALPLVYRRLQSAEERPEPASGE